ncbi:hypothetical protein PBI_INDLOVU_56 [Mycobacterium phage Indlovu]|nr:hypothetical protein PBI_INDLOVU_56 [Mycobacterium phage Indlovu]
MAVEMKVSPPVVAGYCPACGGHDTLRLQPGMGIIKCAAPDCPDPEALSDLIDPPEGMHIRDHLVKLTRDGITVQHPMIERIEGELFGCAIAQAIIDAGRSPLEEGTYAVQVTDLADHPNDWNWERIR